jgi:hypothetical protein
MPALRSLIVVTDGAAIVSVAFASDTVSITTMEIIDNAFILIVPGAMAAGLSDALFLFWWSLALSLVIAFALTVPVNR